MRILLDWLKEPLLDNLCIDEEIRLDLHLQILKKKRMLREVFTEFHCYFKNLEKIFFEGSGIEIELGAGISPIRDSYPEVLATDIVGAPHLDMIINAEAIDLLDCSVKAVFGQNCFHHFSQPDKFFNELNRVLITGGGAILIEPYHGPLASFLYKQLFRSESFDKGFQSWETPNAGPMNGANQALSYIVFVRDRKIFEKKYPNLKIVYQETLGNYLKYLLSGGLNFKQILPDFFTRPIEIAQKLISPFNKWIALHHVIVIKKIH